MSHFAQTYNEEGSTAVLLAIQNQSLDLVKYLIEELKAPLNKTGRFVWEGEEYVDVPPLFAAVISDQVSLIQYLTSLNPFESYDSYLLLFSISKNRSDKIDVLELMGAAYILLERKNGGIGWQLWEEALKLREQIPKIPKILHQPSELLLLVLKEQTSEFRCLKELLSKTVYSLNDAELLGMHKKREEQALLMGERILKQMGKDRQSNLFLMYGAYCFIRNK